MQYTKLSEESCDLHNRHFPMYSPSCHKVCRNPLTRHTKQPMALHLIYLPSAKFTPYSLASIR